MIPALPKGSLGHLRNAERSYAKLRRYGVRGNGHAPPEYAEARAAFLAELRALAALGVSQRAIGERLGISRVAVNKWAAQASNAEESNGILPQKER